MPEIVFKGKEYVYNHHLTVPYRPLVVQPGRGIGPDDLGGNLVVHGDNLHALKALLPRYAGKVDLIFIDPPYNTGNEGWCYNDNVNSPIMKEWLSTNPVDGEDLLRHDKWLCMMWPRLVLLRELLSERGSLWMTLDDNEVHRARMVMDEIFGEENFVSTIVWQRRISPESRINLGAAHDYILGYAKSPPQLMLQKLRLSETDESRFGNSDNDPNGPWVSTDFTAQGFRKNQMYKLETPAGVIFDPPNGRCWAATESEYLRLKDEGRMWFGVEGNARPRIKTYLREIEGKSDWSWWTHQEAGHNQEAKKELIEIFGGQDVFPTPKPTKLLERLIALTTYPDSLILDSFAGSGTTAHAVLKANAKDDGSRRFILVESEDYADRLTAERVRRAIKGYAWVGTQREELLKEKITFTQFKKADEWLKKIEAIKAREGFAEGDLADQGTTKKKRFHDIETTLKDGWLTVEGVKRISQRVDGLGGEFAYCTLGEPLDIERMLSGERLPTFDALGAWLFHTATGGTLPPMPEKTPQWYLGEAKNAHVWLIFEPSLNFLKSPDAALTLSKADGFAAWGHARGDGKRHLVFAPAKYLSNKQLAERGLDFAPLPFALYREG